MFIHFLCLCPLRLAIMLNLNISKVAYFGGQIGCIMGDMQVEFTYQLHLRLTSVFWSITFITTAQKNVTNNT